MTKLPGKDEMDLLNQLSCANVSRRDFMKFCSGLAAAMGLPLGMAPKIAEAIVSGAKKPAVIWLSAQQCTGCTESLLRSTHPTLEHLILNVISLDYNETLNVAAGHQAEAAKKASMTANKGKYILVVDGSIPFKDNGIYCMIAGKTAIEHLKEAATDAAAVISMGSCAAWGGLPSTGPNPTEAVSVEEALKRLGIKKPIINIPGCPPNPYNFLSTVVHYLTFKALPALDDKNRPKFAYGRIIHENCERRPHFDSGRFALEFGDEGHRKGYCLYKLGCKGPATYANCPSVGFCDVGQGVWPVGIGHPCFGCTEKGVGFTMPIHTQTPLDPSIVTPRAAYPDVKEERGFGGTHAATALVAGLAGAALAGGGKLIKDLKEKEDKEDKEK